MAMAKKCDKCGRYYDFRLNDAPIIHNYYVTKIAFLEESDGIVRSFDVCPKCMNEINDMFLRNVREGE